MSADESIAEEIVEIGIEIVFPGGRSEELRGAAKAWRQLKSEVEGSLKALNKEVEGTVGDTWRGPAANAFGKHWTEFKFAVEQVTADFEEAAKGLDDAAAYIDEVNDEILGIYTEIGISAAVSAAMSFVTLGVSVGAGAARVAMLVKRAVDAAGRLGRLLKAIANVFRAMYNSSKFGGAGKLLLEGAANWAGGTAGGVATSMLSGNGPEWGTNIIGGFAGASVGTGVASSVSSAMGKGFVSDTVSGMAGGAASGVTGDYLDSVRKGEDFDPRTAAVTAVTGAAAGGAMGAAKQLDFSDPLGNTPRGQVIAKDTIVGSGVPIAGGISANAGKDAFDGVDEKAGHAQSAAKNGTQTDHSSATDRIRKDFG